MRKENIVRQVTIWCLNHCSWWHLHLKQNLTFVYISNIAKVNQFLWYIWFLHRSWSLQAGVKISQKFQGSLGPLVLISCGPSLSARFGFSNISYTSGIEMIQHFQGPFGPLVLAFCGALTIFWGQLAWGPVFFWPLITRLYMEFWKLK